MIDLKLLKLITFISTPLLIFTLAVLLSMNPLFITLEYTRSSFPPDLYGLSTSDKHQLATTSLSFLTSWESAVPAQKILTQLTMPGTRFSAYTAEEISHLVDLKRITDGLRIVFIITLTILLTILFQNAHQPVRIKALLHAISSACFTIIGALFIIGAFIFIYWDTFFTLFHQLLFADGTWTFSLDSTLIRLFPQIFWVDYAVFLITLILMLTLIILLASLSLKKRYTQNE